MRETTALGASMAAGIAAGVWKDLAELKQVEKPARRVFGPRISAAERDRLYQRWQRAVDMAKGWEH
jgi:glycerol kinase